MTALSTNLKTISPTLSLLVSNFSLTICPAEYDPHNVSFDSTKGVMDYELDDVTAIKSPAPTMEHELQALADSMQPQRTRADYQNALREKKALQFEMKRK